MRGDRRMGAVPWRGVARALAAAAAVLVLLHLLRGTWPPFVLALVLTYLLAPAVDFLEAYGLRRTSAILLLYLLITLATAVAVVYLIPGFLDELNRLGRQLPDYARQLRALVEGVRQDAARATLPATVRQALLAQIDRGEAWVTARLEGWTEGLVQGLLGAAPLLLAPVLAFYLLADLPRLRGWAQERLGRGRRRRWLELLRAVDHVIGGFIRGQLLVAGFVGLMVAVAAALFGLRFAAVLGVLAALADLIPYFGPIVGALPVLAMAALESPATVIRVAVALVVIQWVENSLLAPRILGRRVGVHPVVVIAALLVAGHHFGLPGLLFAVPVAGLVHVLLAWAWPEGFGGLERVVGPGPGRRLGPGRAATGGDRTVGTLPRGRRPGGDGPPAARPAAVPAGPGATTGRPGAAPPAARTVTGVGVRGTGGRSPQDDPVGAARRAPTR
ncbi:AI-2E family transporter [Thermaerobacter sp. FW80]|uniref:AI-2E family transporter n=1 Tax=Thermaerobacter sp. FW80 TaxID=2546351 RepID=UPI001FA96FD5|nr:AI-2E family transporter [Thermaerobacter sp. FW80]